MTSLIFAFSLVLAASALAVERVPFKANASDQAVAKAAVVQRSDLSAGWKGGATKPNHSTDTSCTDWHPKQSDLLITGTAASRFTTRGLELDSQVDVLQNKKMVLLDWQRNIVAPRAISCMRQDMAKSINSSTRKLISVSRLSFPKLAAQTMAFRALSEVKVNGSTQRLISDFVVVGKGRNELNLMVTSIYASHSPVKDIEVQLARILVARLPA